MNRKRRGFTSRQGTPSRSRLNTDNWYDLLLQQINTPSSDEIINSVNNRQKQYQQNNNNFENFMDYATAADDEFAAVKAFQDNSKNELPELKEEAKVEEKKEEKEEEKKEEKEEVKEEEPPSYNFIGTILKLILSFRYFIIKYIVIGDWGLGIGDWGLGIGPNPQSPIPNPQSPFPMKLFLLI